LHDALRDIIGRRDDISVRRHAPKGASTVSLKMTSKGHRAFQTPPVAAYLNADLQQRARGDLHAHRVWRRTP